MNQNSFPTSKHIETFHSSVTGSSKTRRAQSPFRILPSPDFQQLKVIMSSPKGHYMADFSCGPTDHPMQSNKTLPALTEGVI